MPISLPGKLRIKRINGSNGSFCVGDLETEIGEFRVKDAVLDQFDEGVYTGQFWIQQIFPWSYSSYGRMVIEVRAKLADRGGSANPDIELSEISASMGDGNRLPRSRSNEKTPP